MARRLERVVPSALDRERRLLAAHRRRAAESGRRGARSAARVTASGEARLAAGARRLLRTERTRIDGADARRRALDPRRVLERGYTITRDADGHAVRAAADVAAGNALVTETADGEIRSRVEDR